ncbi:methionyl-tRNA formyltransferase [Halobacteriovorax sp. GB3]|uniref:methionyl-tRNA formyltransferase n=1 Tax=Halobacteriovorax sp. GB3 TaxID=2719615 RepID=UPI00235E5349|nr:methionyl-tRNA formyltransferase [Halobacteriovorax sp. GB3]MDD0854760.1 methionyl-tRNA formyltransferase [Halobacteriovorax sp. GB3]
MKKFNVVFCGTPDFSVPTLELLSTHPQINLKGVITMPDRPAGRGQKVQSPPVAEFAKSKKIPLYQTENINREEEFLTQLENEDIDFFVVLAFAQFLGSRVLNMPKLGCFNIHTSILPKYRGAAPIQYALLNGDKETGVSIQKMVKKMDAGDLIISDPLTIGEFETGGQLYTRLKFQAALSCNSLISKIDQGNLEYTAQDESSVSFAPTLKKEDGLLNFKESTFEKLQNQIRALDPWPGTYCFLNKKRLKVFEIEKFPGNIPAGELDLKHNAFVVGCKDCAIRLKFIQLEGKKAGDDKTLLNGLQNSKEILIINPEV